MPPAARVAEVAHKAGADLTGIGYGTLEFAALRRELERDERAATAAAAAATREPCTCA